MQFGTNQTRAGRIRMEFKTNQTRVGRIMMEIGINKTRILRTKMASGTNQKRARRIIRQELGRYHSNENWDQSLIRQGLGG